MSAATYFPLDIESAKMYGITKWREEFLWPVSYQSYVQMGAEIRHTLNELIEENVDNDLSELLLINYKLFLEYNNFLYSLRVLKEVYKDGLTPLYSGSSINCKGIIENGIPLKRLLAVPSIQPNSFIKKLKTKLISAKVHWKLSKSLTSLLKKPLINTDFVTDKSFLGSLVYEYIRKRLNGCIQLKTAQDWYSMSNDIRFSRDQNAGISLLTKGLVQKIEKIAADYDLKLTKLQLKYLHDMALELFLPTMSCLSALKKYVSTLKPINLLIGSGGNHFARMLSVAVQSNGGTVTSFKHGEPVIYLCDYYSWIELSTVDRFITHTKHSARAMEAVLNVYPPLRANNVKIEGMETSIFHDLWRKESKRHIPGKIERVMLITKAIHCDNMMGPLVPIPQLMQIDLELRILNIMKRANCEVIYKYHPDSHLPDNILNYLGSNVQVISERFEDVMSRADAFLFYHSRSTTFGQALCTNKPIIYINGGWETWLPEIYELIAKRCCIVSAHFDERNRLIINEEELLDALARKPVEPDTEFIERYMLPDSLKA